jgi:hypothetical protein
MPPVVICELTIPAQQINPGNSPYTTREDTRYIFRYIPAKHSFLVDPSPPREGGWVQAITSGSGNFTLKTLFTM